MYVVSVSGSQELQDEGATPTSSIDRIVIGGGRTFGDLTLTRTGDIGATGPIDLLITAAGGFSLTVFGQYDQPEKAIEFLEFDDGSAWDLLLDVPLIVNRAPVFVSAATFSLKENTIAAGAVAAVDPDAGDSVTYGVLAGGDGDLFAIDAVTGALSFITAPDFEAPADANGDNVYALTVSASDGRITRTQALSVAVSDAAELRTIILTAGADVFATGTIDHMRIDALAGDDSISTGSGHDTVIGGSGVDTLLGGDGNDSLDGGTGADSTVGGAGNDDYVVGTVSDVIVEAAGGGFDRVFASSSHTLSANAEQLLQTGSTNAFGNGNALDNRIEGNVGANSLSGGDGADTIPGGSGDDTIAGGGGADSPTGGLGIDTASYQGAAAGVTVDLAILVAQNTIGAGVDTLNGLERVTGSLFGDSLLGDAGGNVLAGGNGNDALIGRGGADTLVGGAGTDIFRFFALSDSTVAASDRIVASGGTVAFESPGALPGDRISVSAIDADVNIAGNQAFLFGETGIGRLWTENDAASTDTFVLAEVDNIAGIDLRIRIEDGAVLASAYTAADFIL